MTPRDRAIHTAGEIRQKALSVHNQAQNPEPDWDRIARDFQSIEAKAALACRDMRFAASVSLGVKPL